MSWDGVNPVKMFKVGSALYYSIAELGIAVPKLGIAVPIRP